MLRKVLLSSAIVALVALLNSPLPALAAPDLKLSWPSGTTHRINTGYTYGCGTHWGDHVYAIDFEFSYNQPVSSTSPGTVLIASDQSDGYGKKVVIDHGTGYRSLYAHLASFAVSVGQGVTWGQTVGYADSTGNSTGDHLHFHMTLNGSAYVPEPMSGVTGFGSYGYCTGQSSPYWDSAYWHLGASPYWTDWGAVASPTPTSAS